MKKIISLLICFSLIFSTAYAFSDMDFISSKMQSYDIFRYINSKFIKETENTEPDDAAPDNEEIILPEEENDKINVAKPYDKPLTMRKMTAGMCVAESVARAVINGEDVTKVVYHTGNEGKRYECYFYYKSYNNGVKFNYDNISAGSIFYAGVNNDGFVSNYAVIAVPQKSTKLYSVDAEAVSKSFNNSKVKLSYSYIEDIIYRNGKTTVVLGNGEDLYIADDAAQFTYINHGRNPEVYAGSFDKSRVDEPSYSESTGQTEVYMVCAMSYDGETVAICSVTTPAYIK